MWLPHGHIVLLKHIRAVTETGLMSKLVSVVRSHKICTGLKHLIYKALRHILWIVLNTHTQTWAHTHTNQNTHTSTGTRTDTNGHTHTHTPLLHCNYSYGRSELNKFLTLVFFPLLQALMAIHERVYRLTLRHATRQRGEVCS